MVFYLDNIFIQVYLRALFSVELSTKFWNEMLWFSSYYFPFVKWLQFIFHFDLQSDIYNTDFGRKQGPQFHWQMILVSLHGQWRILSVR